MAETIAWQKADGSDGLTLVGASDCLNGLRVNGQPVVQVRTALRRPAAKPINRGNLANRVSFSVKYAPAASHEAARQAAATLKAALQAKLATHALLEGVFGAFTWQLSDAALE